MVVPPVYRLFPLSVSVPAPSLVRLPGAGHRPRVGSVAGLVNKTAALLVIFPWRLPAFPQRAGADGRSTCVNIGSAENQIAHASFQK